MTNNLRNLPEIGDLVVGRYRIICELGRGGYGVVYRARQEAIDRDVAIKFLLPDIATNPTEVERFRREVFHASSLKNPHTITLYDYGKSPGGLFYVVMEFLEGMTLRDWINDRGSLEPRIARQLLEQVLGSLNEAHQRELVHRDLKPDNIFINQPDTGKLDSRVLDFGLSKFIGDPRSTLYRGPSLTADGEVCGTPQYMSPEHAYGETVGPPGDIYSLGLVIHEVLTGVPAFDGGTPLDILLRQVKEPVPPLPESFNDTVIADFVERSTPKNSEERFTSAGEALKWLFKQPDRRAKTQSGSVFLPVIKKPPIEKSSTEIEIEKDSTQSMPMATAPTPTNKQVPPAVQPCTPSEPAAATARPKAPSTLTSRNAALDRFELRAAQTPLIGRRRTLARLDAWLERAAHSGGLFAITGDAGSGKSALLNTWYSQLKRRRQHQLLRGNQPRNADPLAGLRDAFKVLLGADASANGGDTRRLNLREARHLAELFDPARLADIGSNHTISSVVHGLMETLEHLSRDKPVLLIFDDLHHADPVTRAFFDRLLDSMNEQQRPITCVVTARQPHTIENWSRLEHAPFTHWPLPELAEPDLERLLRRLLPVTDVLATGILQLASGNPALLLHICRYLLESELIEFRDDRDCWTLNDPSIPIEDLVPLDLQELIIERANRYLQNSTDEVALRAILHRSVLLGDEFDAQLLQTCLRSAGLGSLADKSPKLLATLASSGLLQRHQAPNQVRYGFARPLHRASLVRMVESIDDWRSFHQLVADTLIDQGTKAQQLNSARIGHHLERARKPGRAMPWWLRAAQRAESEHRFHDALRMLHRALRLQSDRASDPALIATMRLQQGRLSRHVGELGPAEDALREAINYARRCEDTNLRASAGELLADVVLLQGRLNEAEQLVDEVTGIYEVLDDAEGKQRLRLARANVAMFRGEYAAAGQVFKDIQASASESKNNTTTAPSLVGLARCQYTGGHLLRARDTAEEARHRAHLDGDRRTEAAALVEASHIALLTEGIEAGESLAHQALTLARREHDLLGQANAHLSLGICLRRSTNIDRARFHSRRARELHESLGHLYGIIKDILLSAELAWVQGEPERALILAEDTSRLHEKLGDQHGWALSALFRSLFLIELSRPAEARHLLQEVMEIKGRDQLGLYEPQCLFYLGLANEAESNIEAALASFSEAQSIAEKMGNREVLSLASINLAKLQLITGDLESARREIPLALREAETLGHAYANIFCLLGCALLARLDGDPENLRDYMTRLRTYLVTPNAPKMRLPSRLRAIRRLVDKSSPSPQRQALAEAIDDLRNSLE